MRLAAGLAFRMTSRSLRNKWRGLASHFLTRLRVAAAAAAHRAATRKRGGGFGRHGGIGADADPERDASGGLGWTTRSWASGVCASSACLTSPAPTAVRDCEVNASCQRPGRHDHFVQ